MVDNERVEQVRAMSKVLAFFLPPPARAPIADKLYGLGIRYHPELATMELSEPEGAANLGNWRSQHVQKRTLEGFLQWADPDLYAAYTVAETDEQRAAVREQIRFKHGSKIADLEQRYTAAQQSGELG